jgi:hypothetical protein
MCRREVPFDGVVRAVLMVVTMKRFSTRRVCVVALSGVVGLIGLIGAPAFKNAPSTFNLASLGTREVTLQTIDGKGCLLGVELLVKPKAGVKAPKTAAFHVKLRTKGAFKSRKFRPGIFVRHLKGSYLHLDTAVKPGKTYEYRLVRSIKNGVLVSRVKVHKVSKLRLCSDVPQLVITTTGGTPTPTPTAISTPSSGTPTPTPGPVTCSFAQLLGEWNRDGVCDFDQNSIVDGRDLDLFLTQPQFPPVGQLCESAEMIVASYGRSGVCDLNGDGTTDATDLELFVQNPAGYICPNLTALLSNWGGAGACDVVRDGAINGKDFARFMGLSVPAPGVDPNCNLVNSVLYSWGSTTGGVCDKDGSGVINGRDLVPFLVTPNLGGVVCASIGQLVSLWGPTTTGSCDLNSNGIVGPRDFWELLGFPPYAVIF